MPNIRPSIHPGERKPAEPIKTTLMDLVRAIGHVTDDDRQVMALVKNVFASHRVRLARSLAPVRLVSGKESRRLGMSRKKPAFA